MYQTCVETTSDWQYPNGVALNHGRYMVCDASSIMPSPRKCNPLNFPFGHSRHSHFPLEMLRPEITAVFWIQHTPQSSQGWHRVGVDTMHKVLHLEMSTGVPYCCWVVRLLPLFRWPRTFGPRAVVPRTDEGARTDLSHNEGRSPYSASLVFMELRSYIVCMRYYFLGPS